MVGMIVPLRSAGEATSALASFDEAAAELLADGRAETLTAAQLIVILVSLCAQRDKLIAVIDDLKMRPLSGDEMIDTLNTSLSVEACKGLASIDALIQYAEACVATTPSPGQTV